MTPNPKPNPDLIEEIERMMYVYEIYELSEESGLQEQFEIDIKNLINKALQTSKNEEITFLNRLGFQLGNVTIVQGRNVREDLIKQIQERLTLLEQEK